MKLERTLEKSGHPIPLTQMQTHSSPGQCEWCPLKLGLTQATTKAVTGQGTFLAARALHYNCLLFIPFVLPTGGTPGRTDREAKQRLSLLLNKGNFSPLILPLLTERSFGPWLLTWNYYCQFSAVPPPTFRELN